MKKLSVILIILIILGTTSGCVSRKNSIDQSNQSITGTKDIQIDPTSVTNESLVTREVDVSEIIQSTENTIPETIGEDIETLPDEENKKEIPITTPTVTTDSFTASEVDISQIIESTEDTIPDTLPEEIAESSEEKSDMESEPTQPAEITEPTHFVPTNPPSTDEETDIGEGTSNDVESDGEKINGTEVDGSIWNDETVDSEDMSGGEVEIEF